MKRYETIQINIIDVDFNLKDIEGKASDLGFKNISDFVREGLKLLMGFDEIFYKKMVRYSKSLNIPLFVVVQNFIIKRLAEDAAKTEIWGPSPVLLDEFVYRKTNNGEIRTTTGEELFNIFKEKYIKELIAERVQFLLEKERVFKLTDEEKKFMIKNQAGKVYVESEEYKKEIEKKSSIEQDLIDEGDLENNVAEWTSDVDE